MTEQSILNYRRIAEAIEYIRQNFREQPNLDEVAARVNMSPFHFQKLFHEWAGVSPKKFLQYISAEYAKRLLTDSGMTLFDAAHETGLSGTSRLHDLFIRMEGMSPAQYKSGGRGLLIHYSYAGSPFGRIIVASTARGICYMAFEDEPGEALTRLRCKFPGADIFEGQDEMHHQAIAIFRNEQPQLSEIKLHLKGSPFQLKVWEALLKIPLGKLSTYGSIAQQIAVPAASRAVGTAIGSNPVAFLIPCHRVIQSTGVIGGYMWGNTRKQAIIGWEGAQLAGNTETSVNP